MSEELIQCAECHRPTPEGELVYDDDLGADVCEDCYDDLIEQADEDKE